MKRVVIVTGGTSGIGFATAKKFLSAGDSVVIAGIDAQEKIDDAMQTLQTMGEATFVRCDVTKVADCEQVVKTAIAKYGPIDVLANIAGIVGKRENLLHIDLEEIRKVIDVNLMGTIAMAQAVAKAIVANKGKGVIINTGSIDGIIANPENVAYHASKGGVRMVTKAMARELSPFGIRVASVAPGWVHTPMLGDMAIDFGKKLHMDGRILEPEEIANMIYLISLPEASAVNGATVMADDGYSSFKGVDGYHE
ncbi:MAG TPA: short-chain dehydrogenase [Lactobacillus sp.]|nr:short-chain dehydrogenase [Lactobacillus sp.]